MCHLLTCLTHTNRRYSDTSCHKAFSHHSLRSVGAYSSLLCGAPHFLGSGNHFTPAQDDSAHTAPKPQSSHMHVDTQTHGRTHTHTHNHAIILSEGRRAVHKKNKSIFLMCQ